MGVTPDIGKSVNKNKKGVASKAKPRRRAAMLDYSASSLEEDEGEKRSLEDTEESSQSDEEVEKKKVEKKPPTSVTRKTSARNAKNMNDTSECESVLTPLIISAVAGMLLKPQDFSNFSVNCFSLKFLS